MALETKRNPSGTRLCQGQDSESLEPYLIKVKGLSKGTIRWLWKPKETLQGQGSKSLEAGRSYRIRAQALKIARLALRVKIDIFYSAEETKNLKPGSKLTILE